MEKTEIWKPIPGFPGYEASDHGRIRSYHKRGMGTKGKPWHISDTPQRILKQAINTPGRPYPFVHIMDEDGKKKTVKVHSLILLAFIGPAPENMVGCHNDDDPGNNNLSNLRYDTMVGNLADVARDKWALATGKRTKQEIIEIRQRRANGENVSLLANEFNCTTATIYAICTGRTYTHLPGPITHSVNTIQHLEKKKEIYRLRTEKGWTFQRIGKKFKMTEASVHGMYNRYKENLTG